MNCYFSSLSTVDKPLNWISLFSENVPFLGVDNPWFGSHEHGNNSDPLGLEWPADYDNHTVNSCSYREFKNLTVFSHAEFIHDYLDFRHCIGKTSLDDWVKSNLIAETGKFRILWFFVQIWNRSPTSAIFFFVFCSNSFRKLWYTYF